MKFHIPIKLPSLLNLRLHWATLHRMREKQKKATWVCMRKALESDALPSEPLLILITRIGPRRLDGDNLQGACKHVRDQIAKEISGKRIGVGDDQYTWRYEQRNGPYGVDVQIVTNTT